MKMPNLRFVLSCNSEYIDTKFGDLLDEKREKTKIENEDVLLSSAIEGMFLNSELFSHQRGSSNIGYIKVKKNDLILSAQNLHLGNANVNIKYEHGIVSPAYKVYELKNCDPKYMFYWIKRPETNNMFYNSTTTGASECRRNVDWNTLYNQRTCIPQIEEQEKIANFLTAIDDYTSTINNELESLLKQKSSLSTKIFNKEISFINKNSKQKEWDICKIKDVAEVVMGQSPSGDSVNEDGDGIYLIQGKADLKGYNITPHRFTNKPTKISEKGDFILTVRAPVGYVTKISYNACLGRGVSAIRTNMGVCSDYLYHFMENNNDIWNKVKQGSTFEAVNKDQINNITIKMPCLEEQEKIANVLSKYDNLIETKQKQLETLKNIKKGFLQQMFPKENTQEEQI